MSHHEKAEKGKPMDDKRKPMTDDKNKQQPMPRAHERDRDHVPGERSDKDSIGQPVQLDPERQERE
jgi:hypothetical protein